MSTGGQVLIVQCPVLDPIGRSIFGWPDSTVSTVQLVDACILEKHHVTCMSSKLLPVGFWGDLGAENTMKMLLVKIVVEP